MTDTSPVAITYPTTEPYPVAVSLNSPALNGAVSDSAPLDEEEPYTIKCICAYEDDDGNTVFCEGCETWQHIECYYHNRNVPDVHNCVDCEPRHLDGRRATERQKRLREQSDGGDRKPKRPGAKSHKKKAKEHGDQVNGFHHRSDSGARDLPPAKKAKTNHRASVSISSLAGAPPLQPDVHKRTATSMSPTKSLAPSIPLYSNEFLHLYDHEEDHAKMDSNLFVNLHLAADLASWVADPAALARASNGRSAQDIFTRSDATLDRSSWPSLSTESITDSSTDIDGQHPTWKILKTRDSVAKDQIVGEITGKIGLLRDYCLDPSNRWQELRHPQPFVFFHPQLPIYVDSRHEGSILRYVRRSCRPNVTMKTYITNEVEYHFCFVAKEDIPANSEITAMWYLDPQLFEATNGIVKQESSDSAQEVAAICISNVLAHFGGCACNPPTNCLLASVDRRRHPRVLDSKQANGKRKRTKSKHNISPPATNSRAGSEATKNMDDDDQDSRSASGSVLGQTRSRDLTPTMQNPHESGESELSAREKRKIAAAEKKFQQLEQDQLASHKKKKRNSGPSSQTTQAQPGYFIHQGTSTMPQRQSYSPPSASSPGSSSAMRLASDPNVAAYVPSPLGCPRYVDSAIQTELDPDDAMSTPVPSPRRPSFIPLTHRLLKRCHADRVRLEEINRQKLLSLFSQPGASPMSSTPRSFLLHATPPSASTDKEDVEMKDPDSPTAMYSARPQAREIDQETGSPSSTRGSTKPPLPAPLPSTAAHNTRIPGSKANGHRLNLRVPLPPASVPALPAATSPGSATTSAMSSPSTLDLSGHHGIVTPGSGVTAPSPAKKKLSLGDYLIRRGTLSTPTSEKSQAQATAMLPPQKSPSEQKHDPSSTVNSSHLGEAEATKPASPNSPGVPMKDVSGSNQPPHVSSLTF